MKKIIVSINIMLAVALSSFSQQVHSTYFLGEWSQRNTLNASFAPEYGYFSLPVLGGITLDVNSNMGLKTFLFPYQSQLTTFLNPNIDGQTFINGLSTNNYLRQSLNLNLLSFGFYTKQNSFWSFGISMKENLNVNLPVDLFRLIKLGMASSTNNVYDLQNLGIEQSNIAQIALGYSRDINSQFRIGANAKLLVGISSESIKYSKLDISLNQNQYSISAAGEFLNTSDLIAIETDQNGYYDFSKISPNPSKIVPAGIGMAIDLGLTYKPFKNLTLAAAINDLGYIKWNAASTKRGVSSSDVAFNGFNVNLSNGDMQSQIDSTVKVLATGMENIVKFKQADVVNDISESIPYNIKVSAEYSIFGNPKHDILLGVLFHSYNSKMYSVNEVVGSLTLKPLSWFTLSGTCDILNPDFNRYGVALNISPRWINLYIASDFVTPKLNPQFIPIDRVNFNLTFGGSFVIGKP